MKVKRFSTARDKDLKCTDPESYIDDNGTLYSRLAKMPIQDLSLIANFRVETMKRYYTGDIREVDYPIVELLMDGLSDIPVRHRISCFENAVFIQIKYPSQLYGTDDANYVPIELAAHIFSLTTSDMTDIADEDRELYEDEDGHSLVSMQWLIDTYEDRLCQLVNYEKLSFKTDGQGEISIIIERKLE